MGQIYYKDAAPGSHTLSTTEYLPPLRYPTAAAAAAANLTINGG